MYDYEVLQRYLAGERDFQTVNLSRLNLAGASLAGINLTAANLGLFRAFGDLPSDFRQSSFSRQLKLSIYVG